MAAGEEHLFARRAERLPGLFVTFEGCEGSGKTTQVEMLAAYLRAAGHDVMVTREPGGTAVGERIRELLLAPEHDGMTARTEALLFAADRAQKVDELIRPALLEGKVVLSDRYVDSSLAYQGVGRGLGAAAVRDLNEWATNALAPDLTFYLDVPYEVALARMAGRPEDRIEREPEQFHARVRKAYLALAERYASRMVQLDATDTPEAVSERVKEHVDRLLGRAG